MISGPERVLLIGASGQLGCALERKFSAGTLVSASNQHGRPGDLTVDLADFEATDAVLRSVRPDVILVAGAMCHLDRCVREPELCNRINTLGPGRVAQYASENNARVVFFSTDHVFDGTKNSYVESDSVNPLNVYSRSKARTEELLQEILPQSHLIIRTGWVYGPDIQRRNFILRLIDQLSEGKTVSVPSDQWGSPTYTDDLAEATHYLLSRNAVGIFHATGPDLCDRASLANKVCREFNLDRNLVIARATDEMPQIAERSLRVLLDCSRLRGLGAPTFRSISDGIQGLKASLRLIVNRNERRSSVGDPHQSGERTTRYQQERHDSVPAQGSRINTNRGASE
tara:strand:+ start:3299 stop:4324 length:1026 start_codon:yes stop_codon:yes gene_type:complete